MGHKLEIVLVMFTFAVGVTLILVAITRSASTLSGPSSLPGTGSISPMRHRDLGQVTPPLAPEG